MAMKIDKSEMLMSSLLLQHRLLLKPRGLQLPNRHTRIARYHSRFFLFLQYSCNSTSLELCWLIFPFHHYSSFPVIKILYQLVRDSRNMSSFQMNNHSNVWSAPKRHILNGNATMTDHIKFQFPDIRLLNQWSAVHFLKMLENLSPVYSLKTQH